MWTDFIRHNWDNLDSDKQQGVIEQMSPDFGIKPKDAWSMITAAKGIHGMIPQIRATPESLGPTQRGGTVTTTPSAEPAVRGVSAPATPQFSQLPQPGEVLSSSILAPTTGGEAYAPGMTPLQVRRQRAQGDIRSSGMDADAQKVAEQALYGVPPSYETGMARIDQQRAAADQRYVMSMNKMNAIYGRPSVIKRGEEELFVWGSGAGAKVMSPDGPVPYVPAPGDTMVGGSGSPPLGSDFRQYIQRMEAERGYPLTAAEVQVERNRFPDMPYSAKVKIGGQDVDIITSRSQVLRGVGANTASPPIRGRGAAQTTPTAPTAPSTKGRTATPTIQPPPAPGGPAAQGAVTPKSPFGGMVFTSQTAGAEDKLADDNELAYKKILDVKKYASPEFMGMWRGGALDYSLRSHLPELAEWMGRPGISPQEALFRSTSASMKNSIMQLLGGVTVPPAEAARIMSELPDPSKPGSWEGDLLKTESNASFLINRIRQRRGEAGVQSPAMPTGTGDAGGYGPVEQFDYKGRKVNGRRNLSTGKIKLEQ